MDKYEEECKRIMQKYPEEIRKVFDWENCQLEFDFLGFLESYWISLSSDFTVIDFGCNQAVQSIYFDKQRKYIGVDCCVPLEYRFVVNENVEHFKKTIQEFIEVDLPSLNLNMGKVFAICSYVPDDEARKMVRNTFKYYRDIYCSEVYERLPQI